MPAGGGTTQKRRLPQGAFGPARARFPIPHKGARGQASALRQPRLNGTACRFGMYRLATAQGEGSHGRAQGRGSRRRRGHGCAPATGLRRPDGYRKHIIMRVYRMKSQKLKSLSPSCSGADFINCHRFKSLAALTAPEARERPQRLTQARGPLLDRRTE